MISINLSEKKLLDAIAQGYDKSKTLADATGYKHVSIHTKIRKLRNRGLVKVLAIKGNWRRYGHQYAVTKKAYIVDNKLPDRKPEKKENTEWTTLNEWLFRPVDV